MNLIELLGMDAVFRTEKCNKIQLFHKFALENIAGRSNRKKIMIIF